jgi:hypothetical protein
MKEISLWRYGNDFLVDAEVLRIMQFAKQIIPSGKGFKVITDRDESKEIVPVKSVIVVVVVDDDDVYGNNNNINVYINNNEPYSYLEIKRMAGEVITTLKRNNYPVTTSYTYQRLVNVQLHESDSPYDTEYILFRIEKSVYDWLVANQYLPRVVSLQYKEERVENRDVMATYMTAKFVKCRTITF